MLRIELLGVIFQEEPPLHIVHGLPVSNPVVFHELPHPEHHGQDLKEHNPHIIHDPLVNIHNLQHVPSLVGHPPNHLGATGHTPLPAPVRFVSPTAHPPLELFKPTHAVTTQRKLCLKCLHIRLLTTYDEKHRRRTYL